MEPHPSNLEDPTIMQNDAGGEAVCEKNVGIASYCNGFHGQPTCHETSASFSTHHGVQYSLDSHGEFDGSTKALCDIDAKQRSNNKDGEDDRMEFDGVSEASPFV
ncbi:hypothetical protein ACB092_11G048200 [Castanea dentata]